MDTYINYLEIHKQDWNIKRNFLWLETPSGTITFFWQIIGLIYSKNNGDIFIFWFIFYTPVFRSLLSESNLDIVPYQPHHTKLSSRSAQLNKSVTQETSTFQKGYFQSNLDIVPCQPRSTTLPSRSAHFNNFVVQDKFNKFVTQKRYSQFHKF